MELVRFITHCSHCLSAESTPFLSVLPERNAVEPQRKGRLVKGLPPLNNPRRWDIRQRQVLRKETHRLGAGESVRCGIQCKRLKLQLKRAVCFYDPWQSPAVLAALTGNYLVASLLIMTANIIPGPVPRTLEYDSSRCSMPHQRLHYKRRAAPHQDSHQAPYPAPRTTAAHLRRSYRRIRP